MVSFWENNNNDNKLSDEFSRLNCEQLHRNSGQFEIYTPGGTFKRRKNRAYQMQVCRQPLIKGIEIPTGCHSSSPFYSEMTL